jgi:hypothetical protein
MGPSSLQVREGEGRDAARIRDNGERDHLRRLPSSSMYEEALVE